MTDFSEQFKSAFNVRSSEPLVDEVSGQPILPATKLKGGTKSSYADVRPLSGFEMKPPRATVDAESLFGKPGPQSVNNIRQPRSALDDRDRYHIPRTRQSQTPFADSFSSEGAESTRKGRDDRRFYPRHELKRNDTQEFIGPTPQRSTAGARATLGDMRAPANADVANIFRAPAKERSSGGGQRSMPWTIDMPERRQADTMRPHMPAPESQTERETYRQDPFDIQATMPAPKTDVFEPPTAPASLFTRTKRAETNMELQGTLRDEQAVQGWNAGPFSTEAAPPQVPKFARDTVRQMHDQTYQAPAPSHAAAGYTVIPSQVRDTLRQIDNDYVQGPGRSSAPSVQNQAVATDTVRSQHELLSRVGTVQHQASGGRVRPQAAAPHGLREVLERSEYAQAPEYNRGQVYTTSDVDVSTQRDTPFGHAQAPHQHHSGFREQDMDQQAPVTTRQGMVVSEQVRGPQHTARDAGYANAPQDAMRSSRPLTDDLVWNSGPSKPGEDDTFKASQDTRPAPARQSAGAWLAAAEQPTMGGYDTAQPDTRFKQQDELKSDHFSQPYAKQAGAAPTSYESLAEEALRGLPQRSHHNPPMRDTGARTQSVDLLETDRESLDGSVAFQAPHRSAASVGQLGKVFAPASDPTDQRVYDRTDRALYERAERENPYVVEPLFEKAARTPPLSPAGSRSPSPPPPL